MNILYIINGLGFAKDVPIGGSDKRAIELARNLNRAKGFRCQILTTESGERIFLHQEGLKTKYFVINRPSWWVFPDNLWGRTLSYLYSVIASLARVRQFRSVDLFYSTTDFFFDLLPAWFFAHWHRKPAVAMVHHYIVRPNARSGNRLANTLLFLSQRLGFFLINHLFDAVFFYDSPEGREVSRLFPRVKRRFFVKNGIDEKVIDRARQKEKAYQACFVGGIRPSKGIDDFIPIWRRVIAQFPKATLLVIGGGSAELVGRLKREIQQAGLGKQIVFAGSLSGEELFERVKQAEVFVLPSYEEGWGIALCEAMYCALPAVVYRLPAFKVFGGDLIKVKRGDTEAFAKKVIWLLRHPRQARANGERLRKVAKKFSWSEIAREETPLLKSIQKL